MFGKSGWFLYFDNILDLLETIAVIPQWLLLHRRFERVSSLSQECQFSYIDCPNSAFCVARVQRQHLQSHLQSCRPPVTGTPKILEEAAAMDAAVHQQPPIIVNNVAPVAKKTTVVKKKKPLLPKVTLKKVSLSKKPKAEVRVWRPGFKKD